MLLLPSLLVLLLLLLLNFPSLGTDSKIVLVFRFSDSSPFFIEENPNLNSPLAFDGLKKLGG